MDDFKEQVKEGFVACKSDISTLSKENLELNQKVSNLESDNKYLKNQVLELTSQVKGIEIALNYIKDFNTNSNIQKPNQVSEEIRNDEKIIQKPTPKITQDPYEALLAFKAKSNKREMLKQKLISMITESGINLSELKFLFVDHYKYCSKATFYNYIKELEYEKYVVQKRENHKSFIYLLNSIRNEM